MARTESCSLASNSESRSLQGSLVASSLVASRSLVEVSIMPDGHTDAHCPSKGNPEFGEGDNLVDKAKLKPQCSSQVLAAVYSAEDLVVT